MNSTRIPGLSSFIKRHPNMDAVERIMDKLPQAAVVVHTVTQKIILSNAKTLELTSYTRDELRDKEIYDLLPNLADLDQNALQKDDSNWDTLLIQRSGKQIVVQIETTQLNHNKDWRLVTIKKIESMPKPDINLELSHQRLDAFKLLTQAIINTDQKNGFTHILQAGLVITGGAASAVYLPTNDNNSLYRYSSWGNSELFPEKLPFLDIEHLRIPNIWIPGVRIITDLHRIALTNRMNYLASIPLDEDEPRRGILVVCGHNGFERDQLTNDLLIISSALLACDNNNTIINNLEDGIKKYTSRQSASQMIENVITEGLIFADPDLNIISINKMAENTLGYRSDEVVNQHLDQILIGSNTLIHSLHEYSTKTGIQDIGKVKLRRRNGQSIITHIRVIPLLENDRLIKFAILISDLSQYEEYSAKTKQLEQQAFLGEVTAIFAHEVRNPINNISTGLQLMALKNPENSTLQNQINTLKQDCDRLEELMKSVLSVSKSRDFNMKPIDLDRYFNNLIDRLQPRLNRFNVEYTLHIEEGTPEIVGDQHALDQVFTNLINNALEAMKKQDSGILAIKAKPSFDPDGTAIVEINVSDNGPGIPLEIQERIFEPFFTTDKNGTGLGLAITKRIITAHNGKISLNSFPGGTVFQITMPAL